MKVTDGFVPYRGYETWYRIAGDLSSDRVPLLLLHGGPGGASDYFVPLEAFAGEGRPVVRYDQLGGGRSDRPRDPSLWTIDTFVEEVAAVRDHLGLDRIHLLGQSWGGTLAAEYLYTKPTGVVSLVMHSAPIDWVFMVEELERLRAELPADMQLAMKRYEDTHREPRPSVTRPGRPKKRLSARDIERQAKVMRAFGPLLMKPFVQRLAIRGSAVPFLQDAAYQILSLELNKRHSCRLLPDVPLFMYAALAGLNRQCYEAMWGPTEFVGTGTLKDYDSTTRLRELDVPTLVINGRHDSITPAQGEILRDNIRGAEMVVFENSSHAAHMEEPERYMQVVGDFIAKAEAGAPDARAS